MARDRPRAARGARAAGSGAALDAEQRLTRFTLGELFADPKFARLTVIALLMSLTTTVGWWGISTWVPPFVGSLAGDARASAPGVIARRQAGSRSMTLPRMR